MTIIVDEQPSDELILKFMPYWKGQRLWIRDTSSWFPSIGWCPHINLGAGECNDCALVLDED